MKKQTAVEYLLEQMGLEQLIFPKNIIDKALEMEKQQIINACNWGSLYSDSNKTSEQYYKETFKSE